MNQITSSTALTPKPGWQTSEFWLKVAAVLLTSLYASGVIPPTGSAAEIAAIAATVLGALGYSVSRALVKSAASGAVGMGLQYSLPPLDRAPDSAAPPSAPIVVTTQTAAPPPDHSATLPETPSSKSSA